MEKKNEANENAFENLTLLQIRYLSELHELNRQGKKKGAIRRVAEICGVAHPTVSRFFKSCVEKRYLTEEMEFTPYGSRMLDWHQRMQEEVKEFLARNGVKEGAEDILRGLIENVNYNSLDELTKSSVKALPKPEHSKEWEPIRDIRELISYGNYEVAISIYRLGKSGKLEISMADRGFEPIAMIRHSRRSSYLELTIREMRAMSGLNGQNLSGHLAALRYQYRDMLKAVEIRGGKIRIPLDACSYQPCGHGVMRGSVIILVDCSVGLQHMPESAARLTFML